MSTETLKGLSEKNILVVQTEIRPNLYFDVVKSTFSYETLEAKRNNTTEGTYDHNHLQPVTMTPNNEHL